MSHTAFFYGTLMAPQVLSRVTGHSITSLTIRPAILPDHRRHRVQQADYPALLFQTDASTRGTLVAGLTDADMRRLDVFEGSEYKRRQVTARLIRTEKGVSASEAGSAETVLHVDTSVEEGEGERKRDGDSPDEDEELGEEVDCETYVWSASRQDLEDAEWDFDEFVREKLWRWAGSDNEYREVDEAVRAEKEGAVDPTGGRNFLDATFERAVESGDTKQEKEVLQNAI